MLADFPLSPFAIEHPKALIATIFGFVVLLALLWRFAIPGARTVFADRTTHIADVHQQAERTLADAQQIRNDYANRIAGIEVEHRQRLESAVRDSDAARAAIIADAEEAARALRRRTEEEIARERTRQRILMRRQIVQITVDFAEQAILELNSDPTQRKLITDFVSRVGIHAGNGAAIAPTAVQMPTRQEGA